MMPGATPETRRALRVCTFAQIYSAMTVCMACGSYVLFQTRPVLGVLWALCSVVWFYGSCCWAVGTLPLRLSTAWRAELREHEHRLRELFGNDTAHWTMCEAVMQAFAQQSTDEELRAFAAYVRQEHGEYGADQVRTRYALLPHWQIERALRKDLPHG